MRLVLITGGGGDLALALRAALEATGEHQVHAPGRDELDVRDINSIENYFSRLPQLHLLVNNAALLSDALSVHQSPENLAAVLDTNLRGPWLCARAALPALLRSGSGHIVNIGSHSGRRGGPPGQTAYSASKAALHALTQTLAAEHGPANLRANTVLPGWMETRFTRHLPPSAHATARSAHLLERFGTAAAAARFIAFLDLHLPHTSAQLFQLDSRPGRDF